MLEDNEGCSGGGCGCNMSYFPTSRECPVCGERLRLAGRSQMAEFRLTCRHCGYQGSRLTQEELHEMI
ncbi:hypothetical protein ACFLYF_03065 [Chloroflexota bacterium]